MRTHRQLARKHDEGQQFTFNFITYLNARQELARRYLALPPILPSGFFANLMIELQAFTATTFLLLASYRTMSASETSPQVVDVNFKTGLVDQIVSTMELAADRAGGDFAHQAANVICSLSSLLQRPQTSDLQQITLSLPLVGKIHISRKSYAAETVPHSNPSQQPQENWQTKTSIDDSNPIAQSMPFRSSDPPLAGALSYSMEILEDYSFLTDETFGAEQWFTWTGWSSSAQAPSSSKEIPH